MRKILWHTRTRTWKPIYTASGMERHRISWILMNSPSPPFTFAWVVSSPFLAAPMCVCVCTFALAVQLASWWNKEKRKNVCKASRDVYITLIRVRRKRERERECRVREIFSWGCLLSDIVKDSWIYYAVKLRGSPVVLILGAMLLWILKGCNMLYI